MLYRHAVLVGLAQHRRTDGRKQTKARNLLERLRDRADEILRFTGDLAVPFTNNGSERDLRPVKTQIKISGCHRAATGATNWLRARIHLHRPQTRRRRPHRTTRRHHRKPLDTTDTSDLNGYACGRFTPNRVSGKTGAV